MAKYMKIRRYSKVKKNEYVSMNDGRIVTSLPEQSSIGRIPLPPAVVLRHEDDDEVQGAPLYDGQGDVVDDSVGRLPIPRPVALREDGKDDKEKKSTATETDDVGPIPKPVMLAK